ncbi:transporter substrate-binding domain-containing protein [Uliginosibacterium sediminicola]
MEFVLPKGPAFRTDDSFFFEVMMQFRALLGLLAACSLNVAVAQVQPTSRLDEVQKAGKLRVCTPGDYRPFSVLRSDGGFEGIDIDLVQAAAKALGVEAEIIKSSWPSLMKDFQEKCDVAVGGISVTLERQKSAFFTTAYMVNGKAPITKCENVAKFQSVADIDKPSVTVIENPGGSNERFARANFKQAKIVIFNDNTTIFDEILKGNADVMISESVETIAQQKLRPGLCAVNPDKPLQYGEMAWLLPRGDTVFKAWVDQWLHLSKATGDYDRTLARWLR